MAAKDGRTGESSHSFLASIDQVRILLAGFGERTLQTITIKRFFFFMKKEIYHSKKTVFALQVDGEAWRDVVTGQGGHTDTQVAVHAILCITTIPY